MKKRKLFSQYNIIFYYIAVWARRFLRYKEWYFGGNKYASKISKEKLSYKVKKHQSVLIRKLGDSDIELQKNKIANLKIAVNKINNITILPGEVFSFCKLVGLPAKWKGYKNGMELSFGKARAGIGGGLCQISNLIFWLVLHSPLSVIERYHHSFDPFPDDGRVLPFGSGATVFYNYRDLQFKNNTDRTFQIRLWFSEKCLEGDLRIDEELPYTYHVFEKDHHFVKDGDDYYRANEIWREKFYKGYGTKEQPELMVKNYARVMYKPDKIV